MGRKIYRTPLGDYLWTLGDHYPAPEYLDMNLGECFRVLSAIADSKKGDKRKTVTEARKMIKSFQDHEKNPRDPSHAPYWKKYAKLLTSATNQLERMKF